MNYKNLLIFLFTLFFVASAFLLQGWVNNESYLKWLDKNSYQLPYDYKTIQDSREKVTFQQTYLLPVSIALLIASAFCFIALNRIMKKEKEQEEREREKDKSNNEDTIHLPVLSEAIY